MRHNCYEVYHFLESSLFVEVVLMVVKMIKRLSVFFTMMTLIFTFPGCNTFSGRNEEVKVEVYPSPGVEDYRSASYDVKVYDGNDFVETYVYSVSRTSVCNWHRGKSPAVNFLTFGTEGKTRVKVTALKGNIDKVDISPKSKNIKYTIKEGIVEIFVKQNDKLWITINGDDANPLFVFADKPKPEVPEGDNVVYFGPGVHDIGQLYKVENKQTVYLDGGAWVIGSFDVRRRYGFKIIGPGVLSGEWARGEDVHKHKDFNAMMEYNMIHGDYGVTGYGNHVEGITIVNAPAYNIFGGPNTAYSVKLLSPWFYSTDGFYIMPDMIDRKSVIDECFAFVGDNVIFPLLNPFGDCIVTNSFFGSTNNAVYCMLYWPLDLNHEYSFYSNNIDIKTYNEIGIFQCFSDGTEADAGKGIKNMTFENIRIEGDIPTALFMIENRPYPWGGAPDSPVKGNIFDIVFRNVTLEGKQKDASTIYGKDKGNRPYNIIFENLNIGGEIITDENKDKYFKINEFAERIKFIKGSNSKR